MDVAQIERALGVVAYLVVRHGDAYVPLLDRLEKELEEHRNRPDHRQRAQRILASLMKEVRVAPAS